MNTLSGHSFKVKETNVFSFQTVYIRKFQITVEKSASSSDLPFGTVLTKPNLFHVVEKNVPCQKNFQDKLPFVNSTKSLISDLTKIPLPKCLILTYCLIAKTVHYQILFTESKSSYYFLNYVQFY